MLASIKTKLLVSMLVLALLVITIISAAVIYNQRTTLHKQAEQSLMVLSDVLAKNSLVAMAFEDKNAAEEILSALSAKPDIVHATLYDKEGVQFTLYSSKQGDSSLEPHKIAESILISKSKSVETDDKGLHSYTPLIFNEELIGWLHLSDNMATQAKQINKFLNLVLTTSAIAFAISFILALWIQTLFTHPLNKLLNVIKHITTHKDYSQRADIRSNDEFARLANNFNDMISEVEQRGEQLEASNKTLEQLAHYDALTNLPNRTLLLTVFTKRLPAVTVQDHNLLFVFLT